MAIGNKHLGFKETLNLLEDRSPGSKAEFYFGYLNRAVDRFSDAEDRGRLGICSSCGAPTDAEVCAFCRLVSRSAGATQPVAFKARNEATVAKR